MRRAEEAHKYGVTLIGVAQKWPVALIGVAQK